MVDEYNRNISVDDIDFNKLLNTNIFGEEKKLFELSKEYVFQDLTKSEQKRLEKEIKPSQYKVYIYDLDLNQDIIEYYKVNENIYQPTTLNFSSKITNLNKNTRFLVFSKIITEIPDNTIIDEEYKGIGLAQTGFMNCFKVIDISIRDDKTQIALLHYSSLEELILSSRKTEIESKSVIKAHDLIKMLSEDDGNSQIHLNESIKCGIGLREYGESYKFYSKDEIIFLLDLLSDMAKTRGVNDTFEFLIQYSVEDILNDYSKLIEQIESENLEIDEKDTKINNFKDKIIGGLEFLSNLDDESTEKIRQMLRTQNNH
ncbi:MAG: hypothetical protein E7Z84_02460 [Methanosphaera stadtmanae]|nr:hypothetical protein [Methanosphaera stadtmanae]